MARKKGKGELAGKVAIVTGAGTGIGRSIAEAFAVEGAAVVVAGRRARPIEAVAGAIGATAVVADVADEAEVKALVKACEDTHGRLDVLVNNAGITGPVLNAHEMDMEKFDETIAINVRGVILCTKHAIQAILRHGEGGSIINISSKSGLGGYPMRSAYVASKFALIGITQSVAHEVGQHGIRVNAICPGAVSGELMDRVIAARAEAEGRDAAEIIKTGYTDAAALRKWVDPEDVAAAAVFLASDAASSITAEHLKVDAGRF